MKDSIDVTEVETISPTETIPHCGVTVTCIHGCNFDSWSRSKGHKRSKREAQFWGRVIHLKVDKQNDLDGAVWFSSWTRRCETRRQKKPMWMCLRNGRIHTSSCDITTGLLVFVFSENSCQGNPGDCAGQGRDVSSCFCFNSVASEWHQATSTFMFFLLICLRDQWPLCSNIKQSSEHLLFRPKQRNL